MKKIFLSAGLLLTIALLTHAQQKKDNQKAPKNQNQQQATGKKPLPVVAAPPEEVKLSYREIGSILPPLRVVDTSGHAYTEKDFKDNNHFFLVMFNPTCGHCQQMGKMMSDNYSLFQNSKVLFMAGPAVMEYMNSFYQTSSIGRHPEIKVGVDSASAVDQLYNYKMLPQINVYDKNRRLVNIFYGDIPLDSLKKYLP